MDTFFEILTAAVADIAEHGFDSVDRVAHWVMLIRSAAGREMISEEEMAVRMQQAFRNVYRRQVDGAQILKLHPGVPRFTIEKVRPELCAELERRIVASAGLIKLNRQAAIEKTLQRFSGWASSVPIGGTDLAVRAQIKKEVRKPLASLPFEERRVLIDQGHKFLSSLSQTIALAGDAIAGEWHSNFRQPGYNARVDHIDRDHGKTGKVYLVRGSWAHAEGLVKPDGDAGFTADVTQPGEEPFCRCSWRWIYNLRSLPEDMLTAKGRMEKYRMKAA